MRSNDVKHLVFIKYDVLIILRSHHQNIAEPEASEDVTEEAVTTRIYCMCKSACKTKLKKLPSFSIAIQDAIEKVDPSRRAPHMNRSIWLSLPRLP